MNKHIRALVILRIVLVVAIFALTIWKGLWWEFVLVSLMTLFDNVDRLLRHFRALKKEADDLVNKHGL